MKNIILFIVILLSTSLFSIEYNSYEMILENEFSASYRGQGDVNDLAVEFGTQGIGPRGPSIFFKQNELIISDQLIDRSIIVNKDYTFKEVIGISLFDSLTYIMDATLVGVNHDGIVILKNWEYLAVIDTNEFTKFRGYKSVIYYNKYLFIHDKNNDLWSIKEPSMDANKNKSNVINEEDTIKLINSGDIIGLTIDSEKRLFLDGELKTLDMDVFYKYYKGQQKIKNIESPTVNFTMTTEDILTGSGKLLGIDNDSNTYWSSWNTDIAVFNNNGFLIDLFVIDEKYISSTPAISPEGDVFFMDYGKDKVSLYKVPRQW